MTDLFANWKNNKFVVADADMAANFNTTHIVILSSIGFWSEQYENLIEWCKENGGTVSGMTVNIPSDEVLMLFCLRWA